MVGKGGACDEFGSDALSEIGSHCQLQPFAAMLGCRFSVARNSSFFKRTLNIYVKFSTLKKNSSRTKERGLRAEHG